MSPQHHPDDELILGHVVGSLAKPVDVVVASHLALCPTCRNTASDLAAFGGELLEELDDAPLAERGLDAMLARLSEPLEESAPRAAEVEDFETVRLLPAPLRSLLDRPVSELPWKNLFPGVEGVRLMDAEEDGTRLWLLHGDPGVEFPRHAHPGAELTLVLSGGMSDEDGHLGLGDLSVAEPGAKHRPVMDQAKHSYCLVAMERRVVMTGLFSRLRQLVNGY